jgi:hypothetical protein
VRKRSAGIQLKLFAHKRKEHVPRIEQKIFQQGFDVLKKLAAFS